MIINSQSSSLYYIILPLSHKSGALCLYEPLPVSDALGDDFFEIFDGFLVETFFSFFSKLITLHGPTAAKKIVAPQKAIFCSLSGENNSTKKTKIKNSCPRRRWTPESPKPFGRPTHRILPLFPTSPPSAVPSPRYAPH